MRRFLLSVSSKVSARFALIAAAFSMSFIGFGRAQATSTDPLATLVAGVDFTNLETDVVQVGVALAALYIVWVGVHWILKMIRHG